jgi:hypothetical protein
MLAVKTVEFVTDRMLYIILRSRWCDIIILNVHAPTENKIDDMKDSFYEELEYVFDIFPKYYMKILLRDFSAEAGGEKLRSEIRELMNSIRNKEELPDQ